MFCGILYSYIDKGKVEDLLVGLRASLERRVIIRLGERRRGTAWRASQPAELYV